MLMYGALIVFGIGFVSGLSVGSGKDLTDSNTSPSEELPPPRAFKLPEEVNLNVREIDLWSLKRNL